MIEAGKYEMAGYGMFREYANIYRKYHTPACATASQLSCMMGLIKEYRFPDGGGIKNVAEIGVNIGMTDFFVLRMGVSCYEDFRLWGIEKLEDENMGSVVKKEAAAREKEQWLFCPGKTVYDIASSFPQDVKLDMVFIDGAHAHPYPLIDLVYLLPYMREDGLILLHDCEYYGLDGELGNCYIFTSWIGEKYLNRNINNAEMRVAGKETLGIVEVPPPEAAQRIMERVAALPISKPYYHYASWEQMEQGDYLGITQRDLFHVILPYMEKHYSHDFSSAFIMRFSKTLQDYEDKKAWYFHKTRISQFYYDRIKDLQMQIDELRGGGYAFPWHRIKQGSHIILYGGAVVGKAYHRMLKQTNYATVDMVLDRNCSIIEQEWNGVPVCPPSTAAELKDERKILIATESRGASEDIARSLIEFGISAERIIWEDPIRR